MRINKKLEATHARSMASTFDELPKKEEFSPKRHQ
jgi:hypothetical protein